MLVRIFDGVEFGIFLKIINKYRKNDRDNFADRNNSGSISYSLRIIGFSSEIIEFSNPTKVMIPSNIFSKDR
jgi:hypothetical protein